jgi:acetoin utilization deacetylase AcuC-like enzyme
MLHTGFFTHRACAEHEMGSWHPECPERLAAIHDHLISIGIAPHLEHFDASPAPVSALARAHDIRYIERLQTSVPQQGYWPLDPDTSMNPHTWNAALRSAGAVVEATDHVLRKDLANAFCAVRPPGHHARRAAAMGFCILNNVAIGARHALEVHGLERVAVVDFDVHHGNGTEEILSNDERVLMVSFFQHPFYPYTGTDNPVRQVVDEVWLPRLTTFRPQMVFISAGFDAHREDDLGQMGLIESDYVYITKRLMEIAAEFAEGRMVSSLEGGYNLSALGRSVGAHLKTLAQL